MISTGVQWTADVGGPTTVGRCLGNQLVIRAFNATDVSRCTPSDDDLMSDGHRCAAWIYFYILFYI